ncbi:MAG: hypothetical protein AAF744_11130 [Pseudomonadota bacterium]
MKVLRDTPEQLIIENNPIWLAVFLTGFALIFLGIGLFTMSTDFWLGLAFVAGGVLAGTVFLISFVRRTQVIFDRPQNRVEMRRRSLLGYSTRSWALEHFARADVQSSRSDNSTTYRAVMVFDGGMDAGTHPITLVYSSGSGAQRACDAINRWLAQDA